MPFQPLRRRRPTSDAIEDPLQPVTVYVPRSLVERFKADVAKLIARLVR